MLNAQWTLQKCIFGEFDTGLTTFLESPSSIGLKNKDIIILLHVLYHDAFYTFYCGYVSSGAFSVHKKEQICILTS